MTMLEVISEWMRLMNQQFIPRRKSCLEFREAFAGYFHEELLANSYYVVVPQGPVPVEQFLEQHGFENLFNRELAGLTLNDTYYVVPEVADNLRIHFHELVHVAQWRNLGVERFITRYLEELRSFGYDQMPLERMAYELDERYMAGGPVIDVEKTIQTLT